MQEIYQITAALKAAAALQARGGADRCAFQRRFDRRMHRAYLAGGAGRRTDRQSSGRRPDRDCHRSQVARLALFNWWATRKEHSARKKARAVLAERKPRADLRAASQAAGRYAPVGRAGAGQRRRVGLAASTMWTRLLRNWRDPSETLSHRQWTISLNTMAATTASPSIRWDALVTHDDLHGYLLSIVAATGESVAGFCVRADSGADRQPGSVGRGRHLLPQPQRAHGRGESLPAAATSTIASIPPSGRSFSSRPRPAASPDREATCAFAATPSGTCPSRS